MKKSIKLIAVLLLVALAMTAISVFAACTPKDNNDDVGDEFEATGLAYVKSNYNGLECYFVKGIGTETRTSFSVPQTYEGLPVSGIEANAFSGNKNIVEIVLLNSVRYIGAFAFSHSSVKKITATGVTKIMQHAFSDSALESAVLKANGEFGKWVRYYASMQSDAYMAEFGQTDYENNAYVLTAFGESEFYYGGEK